LAGGAAAASIAQSYFPQLEPIAGAVLAINLAYLNLPKFRYRQDISATAKQGLTEIGQLNAANGANLDQLRQYRALQYFSSLSSGPPPGRPEGAALGAFHGLYVWELPRVSATVDAITCSVFATVAAFVLFGGVADNIGIWNSIRSYMSANEKSYFNILMAGFLTPVALVLFGRTISKYTHRVARQCAAEIAGVFKVEAKAVLAENTEAAADAAEADAAAAVPKRRRRAPPPAS
jgi:hypothetical protein